MNKVSQHISKKVADRFVQLFNTEREELEKNYSDLSLFLRYGCMRDEKLYDRVKDTIMFRLTDGKLVTAVEYLEGKDIVGFDISVGERIAKDKGMQLEVVNMDFDSLIPALSSGAIDFIAAGMSVTEERKKNVSFSVPYFESEQVIIVRKPKK